MNPPHDNPRLWAGTRWALAVREAKLPPSAKLVAFVLALRMSNDHGTVSVGGERLARETGLSVKTARLQRQALIDAGWLEVVRPGGGKFTAMSVRGVIPITGTQLPGNHEQEQGYPVTDDGYVVTDDAYLVVSSPELSKNCSITAAAPADEVFHSWNGMEQPPADRDLNVTGLEKARRVAAQKRGYEAAS